MFNDNIHALLELLKASLFDMQPQIPDYIDWDKVLEEAKAQTIVALVAGVVPEEYAETWRNDSLSSKARFLQVLHAQTQLVLMFEQEGIPIVILKGTSAAIYYPKPILRAMGDIDFLVPQDRFEDAKQLMLEKGYSLMNSSESPDIEIPKHVAFKKGGMEFELHHHFSSPGLEIEQPLINGLQRAERHVIYDMSFPMLPETENGLVLLKHACQHLRIGQLGLRQVIDWMMYVNRYLDDERWEKEFRPLATQYGLEKAAVTLTCMCREWLGLTERITWCNDADLQTAEELLYQVFANGNFGRKNGQYQIIGQAGIAAKKQGLFRELQQRGLRNWSAAQKHAVLRPFAWLYQICRWTKRGSTSLLHLSDLHHVIEGAKMQSGLNDKLGL